MSKLLYTTTALLGALAAVNAMPAAHSKREILTPLPENADDIELRFQPFLDFDSDGCYSTAAIDPNGKVNAGKQIGGTPEGQCRDLVQLENSNAYSRRRCNNGYCATMYEYYFEKDQASLGGGSAGHKHDWENIVVFAQGDTVVRVAPSCHGDYGQASNSFPADGTHPLLVYHKDGGSTHCFRFANDDDIANPENPSGAFYRSPVVGWLGWPNDGLRSTMVDYDYGGPDPKIKEALFASNLGKAAGDGVPGFDPAVDE